MNRTIEYPGEFPSGQRGQTVNLLLIASVVRIHLPPPKIADFRQKIGDFYVFTITYSLFTKSKGRFLKVRGNSEYVFLGYDLILTHPYGHNEPTEADL